MERQCQNCKSWRKHKTTGLVQGRWVSFGTCEHPHSIFVTTAEGNKCNHFAAKKEVSI